MFLHLVATLLVMLNVVGKATDKRNATTKLFLHLAAFAFAVTMLFVLSHSIWEWLWSHR